MEKLVLFCKSYGADMLRARRMAQSVQRFNIENILMYISVPERDVEDFKHCFNGIPCIFITDEETLKVSSQTNGPLPELFPPHLIQQLIKLEFWRNNFCKNYLWIDSDSYFIRPFRMADFFPNPNAIDPYTVQEEFIVKDRLEKFHYIPKKKRIKWITGLEAVIIKSRDLFNNQGPCYYFAPSPVIWSCKVLKHLNDNYLKQHQKNIYELLHDFPCETQLYGEYLHYSKVIPIVPINHMFKCFYHAENFYHSQTVGECEYSLAKDYLGICIQSNWARLDQPKNQVQRLKKHLDEFKRSLGLLKFD
ncbi:MAG: DUF6492 family protein [Desulfobacterium sp.]|jgi:hypothetical protein|nr:DUF6492 family protein [Desulfobacterium sp.]